MKTDVRKVKTKERLGSRKEEEWNGVGSPALQSGATLGVRNSEFKVILGYQINIVF